MRSTIGASALFSVLAGIVSAAFVDPVVLDACPGYSASNVQTSNGSLSADLQLAGTACNVFGNDTETLRLEVTYETPTRIHVRIIDPNSTRYEVPEEVFPRPSANASVDASEAQIQFNFTASPFSFSIFRAQTQEVLFSTESHPIIFEPQYLRLKTNLPDDANIYGLGEHTDPFRLDPTNTTRTLWSRDAYGVPDDTNLYGNHPVYFEHRTTGTHAVFLLNSNGMDIKLNSTGGSSLEYNVIGGVFDFYFLAGSEIDPTETARQYAELAGTPAEVPYWSFGFHQCRYGYQNYIDVADVITNYSLAEIPLETMWTDIDYMDRRRVFTIDPDYFPLSRMREIVDYLHAHDQRYVVMTDPAVAYTPDDPDYAAYHRGVDMDVWLKAPNGSYTLALVWPGVTVYPDWFHQNTTEYWNSEFATFYDPETGLDIDGAWIDMNDPASFCDYPCTDPFGQAVIQDLPPARTTSPPAADVPIFNNSTNGTVTQLRKRAIPDHEGENLLEPPYAIDNAAGLISSRTAYTDSVHANGLVEYDTHNIYGTMMSEKTHDAMLARRPGQRTLVITRSTFAGAGRKVGKWLGDNISGWEWYRNSIAGIMGFASIYQVPMVGADICGFGGNTTETLCARWVTLGAFYPFMRNHNGDTSISQEFYRWPTVAEAARSALNTRYRLIDYIYTAFHQASLDGTPVLSPLWFKYPQDSETFAIDLQFFFGPSLLVSPVTEENSTSVTIYLPDDTFYDFATFSPVNGTGANVTLENVDFTEIPLHIRGGAVLPLRVNGTMTTVELQQTDFELIVAPNATGEASGSLYVDDGISISQNATTQATMTFTNNTLTVEGDFGFDTKTNVARVLVLGAAQSPQSVTVDGKTATFAFDNSTQVVSVAVGIPLSRGFQVHII